ncbi:ATP-binding cassette domain-containing protein, partial [Salmonella enterica]|nr:ATP-binding cassette domain-containing protein [Salmonella enterica]
IMIINSRLSGALVGGVNKLYLSRLHSFHIMNSLSELLKDKDTFVSHSGIYISRIQQLSVEKLSISFAERKLIEPLSFTAVPGDFIGIVGASGAGKSSLIKALSNSINCYTGSVKLNNVDITHISEEYIQSCIAYHSTNSSFIKGSLRENFMIYGVVDDSDIIEILTLCCRNLILSKENVDEKFVDELNLSNGEKQKILLCLALFKKPEMVLLDESTSYLSTADALDFLERIKHLYSDSIVIFATHDISLQRLFTRKIELSHEHLRTVSCNTTISIPKMKLNG